MSTTSWRVTAGGKQRAWPEVLEGYANVFEVLATAPVAFHDFTSQGDHDRRLFVGHEKSVCLTPTTSLELRARTTRRFIKIKGGGGRFVVAFRSRRRRFVQSTSLESLVPRRRSRRERSGRFPR